MKVKIEKTMKMNRLIQGMCSAVAVFVLCGCTSGLDKKATAIDWTKGSVVVMTVGMTNQFKPNYPATQLGIVMSKRDVTASREAIYAGSSISAASNTFLVTKQIPANQLVEMYDAEQLVAMQANIEDLCMLAMTKRFEAIENPNKTMFIDPLPQNEYPSMQPANLGCYRYGRR